MVPSIDLNIGDIVWQGSLDDLDGTGTAPPTTGLHRVISFDSNEDLKGREIMRIAVLMRHSEVLPFGD